MFKDTTIVKSEKRSFHNTAYTCNTKFDVHVIVDTEGKVTVSVAKWSGLDEAPLTLDSTLYLQERGNVVIYTNYKTYERPVLGLKRHDYTPEQTVDAFIGLKDGLCGYDLFSNFMRDWHVI
jgi:hypothetical protein